jgi:hypothetical protein
MRSSARRAGSRGGSVPASAPLTCEFCLVDAHTEARRDGAVRRTVRTVTPIRRTDAARPERIRARERERGASVDLVMDALGAG